jgi:hypothetical protein
MKAIINIDILNLKGTCHKIEKVEDNIFYIKVPFLNDYILLTFLDYQITIFKNN